MARKTWVNARIPKPLYERITRHVRHGLPIHGVIEKAMDALDARAGAGADPTRAIVRALADVDEPAGADPEPAAPELEPAEIAPDPEPAAPAEIPAAPANDDALLSEIAADDDDADDDIPPRF